MPKKQTKGGKKLQKTDEGKKRKMESAEFGEHILEGKEESEQQEEESSDKQEEESSDTASNPGVLNVTFEAFAIADDDVEGITKLLIQLFGQTKIDLRDLAKLICKQKGVGCIYQPSEEDSLEESESDVYGLVTVLKLHDEHKALESLVTYLQKKTAKCKLEEGKKQQISADYVRNSKKNRVGFILNERFVNIPPQIAPPSFKSLCEDMKSADMNLTHFLLLAKCQKKANNVSKKKRQKLQSEEDDVIFVNSEEQFLSQVYGILQLCDLQFDFAVQAEGGRGDQDDDVELAASSGRKTARSSEEDEEEAADWSAYKPYRRLLAFPTAVLQQFVEKMERELT